MVQESPSINNIFESELKAQTAEQRTAAALRTFAKLRPTNRITTEAFFADLRKHAEIWTAVSAMGVQDFAATLLGHRPDKSPRAKSGKRTRLTDAQKEGIKIRILAVLSGLKGGLSRREMASALGEAALIDKLRLPLTELLADGKIVTSGAKRAMKYVATPIK